MPKKGKQTAEHIAKRMAAYKANGHTVRSKEYREKISNTLKKKGIAPPTRTGCESWAKGVTNETNEKMAMISYKRSLTQSGKHYSLKTEFKKGNYSGRAADRKNSEYNLWRRKVFIRDGYTCRKYKTKGGELVAHHIFNYYANPSLRTVVSNGCTLSQKAHREFHSKYGNQNNNLEQLNEFLGVSLSYKFEEFTEIE